MKYNFYTGKDARKFIRKGYKYFGKGKLGKIKTTKIDGKIVYYLTDFDIGIRSSPYTFNKSKLKKAEVEEWTYKGERQWREEINHIEKQKSENKLVFKTKIKDDKKRFMSAVLMKFGKKDYLMFHNLNESEIIKRLQLKDGDELTVTFAKDEQEGTQ